MPAGRPTDYNEEIAKTICERLSDGESLRAICLADDMPNKGTVFVWLSKHKEFADQYAKAREVQAERMAEEILEIADDGRNDTYETENGVGTNHDVIARSRLRVDARKWLASKMFPKKYGDKVQQEVSGPDGGAVQVKGEVTFKIVRPDGNRTD